MEPSSSQLLITLRDVFASPADANEQELFYALELHKPLLLRLFDVGPRNASELKDVESGTAMVRGKGLAFNADFARGVVFLAQQLDCSERYCAELLEKVASREPNQPITRCIELVIREFHDQRRDTSLCLRMIFEGAMEDPTGSRIPILLRKFAHDLIRAVVPLSGRRATLSASLIAEIDRIKSQIKTVKLALTSPSAGPQLSEEALMARLAFLRSERHHLGYILFIMSTMKEFTGTEISRLITWLKTSQPGDDLTCYVLAAFFFAIGSAGPTTATGESLFSDAEFVGVVSQELKAEWQLPPLRAAVILQWTLFLSESRARDPVFGDRHGFTENEVEKLVWEAVQGDAFEYLINIVRFVANGDAELGIEDYQPVDVDFQPLFSRAVQVPLLNLIAYMPVILRKIKHRQEDIGVTTTRSTHPFQQSPPRIDAPNPATPRNDIATLFRLLGVLYEVLPDNTALPFWSSSIAEDEYDGKLAAFLRWATESRGTVMVTAAYQMLAGLSKGRNCSELAYNFLSSGAIGDGAVPGVLAGGAGGAFSWAVLFGSLDYYASSMPNPRQMQQHQSSSRPHPPPRMIPPQEVTLTICFLKLLEVVAANSPAARIALFDNPQFRPLHSLLSLISCSIPLELKAALFDTLAAFCGPGAGSHGAELCRDVWDQLEKMEVLSVKGGFGGLLTTARGVKVELEEVETPGKRFPSTQAFLRLLNSLIHTPKELSSRQGPFQLETSIHTIPVNLGLPSRAPGLEPYLNFVIDDVLLKAGQREYSNPTDRWALVDSSLRFIEKSLAAYDIDSPALAAAVDELQNGGVVEPIGAMLVHPGFDIVVRLLTDSSLRREVESFLREGIQALEQTTGNNGGYFQSSVLRVLRIVHRVLEIQNLFIEVLIPLVSQFNSARYMSGRQSYTSPSSLMPFDQNLLFQPDLVVQIALYVNVVPSPNQEEMVLLAVKILAMLADSPQFSVMDQEVQSARAGRRKLNRLAVILGSSEESERIMGGFVGRLRVDDNDYDGQDIENLVGAGAPLSTPPPSLSGIIRSSILDLLLHNTQVGRPSPNISHMLLGFDNSSPSLGTAADDSILAIRDPQAMDSVESCLHVILDLLGEGVPHMTSQKAKQSHHQRRSQQVGRAPLFIKQPLFAEKCYRLVHQLCVHDLTSASITRYLRTREDFFLRQLAVIPIRAPAFSGSARYAGDGAIGKVIYSDQAEVLITCEALTSFIRLRSWVLESVALELHLLTETKQHQRSSQILDLLFGSGSDQIFQSEDETFRPYMDEDVFQPFAPGQQLIRILELLQSFDMEWHDGVVHDEDVHLHFYAGLDFSTCYQLEETGCEILDLTSLISILSTARRSLVAQGVVSTPDVQDQINKETKYLLESCARENHRRQIEHAKGVGFEAWRRVLDISLAKCFDRLPHDRRESILFDIIQELPPVIRRPLLQPSTAVILAEVVLSLITRLREDRHHQLILQSTTGSEEDSYAASLPAERLYSLFRNVLECIVQNGMNELVRGNLYAALTNYFHLIENAQEPPPSHETAPLDISFSFTSIDDSSFDNSFHAANKPRSNGSKRSAVEMGTLTIINTALERLVPIICRDAIDGSEVWKTVAFTLLNSLLRLSRVEKQHRVLGVLVKYGFLTNFVYSLKDSEEDLLAILKPDPNDLNPLYVYEAKMAFLVRMAQTRQGAERLLDARIFNVLSQCDYLAARPEADQTFMDFDSFLPSAIERYHQLLLPALQLADSVLATVGSATPSASKQALEFILAYRETALILLKDSSAYVSLAMIQELQLLVSLCSYVVPRVERHELLPLATTLGFGQINQAILGLAAKTMGKGRWQTGVVPVNETERIESQVQATGYRRGKTIFESKLETAIVLLQRWILIYLVSMSDPSGVDFVPVFLPIASSPREGEPTIHTIASAPTISDGIFALKDILQDLTTVLDQVNDISLKLSNKDAVGVDEIEEIAQASGTELDQLDISQRRLIAFKELERMRVKGIRDVFGRLHSLEMLLLLVWRHLDHFLDSPTIQQQQLQQSRGVGRIQHTTILGSDALDGNLLKQEAAKNLVPILRRLDWLDLSKEVIGLDSRSRMSYIAVISRKLRELTGIRQEGDGDEMDDGEGRGLIS